MVEELKIKIKRQSRVDLLLPYIPLGMVVLFALVLWLAVKIGIISDRAAGIAASGLFLGACAMVTWYVVSPQGEIRLYDRELRIYPLLRRSIRVVLPYSAFSLVGFWQRSARLKKAFVGPILTITSGNNRKVTIGCTDPKWITEFPETLTQDTMIPPQFVIGATDFRKLADRLFDMQS